MTNTLKPGGWSPVRLSAARERELVERAKAGDGVARTELVVALLPLVDSIAKRYRRPYAELRDDLVQEGTVGLLKAINAFDTARGVRLTTFAWKWVDGEILSAIRALPHIKLPKEKAALLSHLARTFAELSSKLGRQPSTAELAAEVGLGESEIEAVSRSLQPLLSYNDEIGEIRGSAFASAALDQAWDGSEFSVALLLEAYPRLCRRLDEVPSLVSQLVELEDGLTRLSEDHFRALETTVFYDLSLGEAGEWLHVHPNTVRNRYKAALTALTDHLSGAKRLPAPLRTLDWKRELEPVESIRIVVRRYQAFFDQLAEMSANDPAGFAASLEVGWVLHEEEGWVPLLSRDIRETARAMGQGVRLLSDDLGPDYRAQM